MLRAILFTLLGLLCLVSKAQKADSTDQLDTTITLNAFTIQGIRTSDSLNSSPIHTLVIDNDEVDNAPVQSTSDLLKLGSSLDVKNRGGLGVQSDLSIRGGTFDQSLVLIDGVKLSDPQTGHHLMNLPLFIDQIERVEVISNGGSRWFGPYAFSGAVNLVTKRAIENQLQVRFSGGDFGYLDAGLSGSFVTKNSSTTISGNHRRSDGFMTNTDFDLTNFSLFSTIDVKNTEFKVNLGVTDKNFGAQNFYTSNFPSQYEATRNYFGSVQAKMDFGKLTVTPRVYYRRQYDRFELYRNTKNWYQWQNGHLINGEDTAASWYKTPNYHRNEVRAVELNAAYKSKFGTTHVGLEYRHESINSNNLGQTTGDTILDYNGAFYTKYDYRENTSAFFEHNGKIEKFRFSIGMLANFHSQYGNDVFPGADVSYDFTKKIRLFAGANRNMRFPTFTDLYYNLGGAQGSIDLQPEQSQNYQLGLRYTNPIFHVTGTGFYRQGQNLIDWIRYNGSNQTVAANITEVNFIGFELDAKFRFDQKNKKAYFKTLIIRYTGMDADRSSDGFESNYVLDYLQHKFYMGIDHKIVGGLMARWAVRLENRAGGYFDTKQAKEVEFVTYGLLDFRLYQKYKGLNWYFEIANLLDTEYRDIGLVQQPGRWLKLGASYTIKFKKK